MKYFLISTLLFSFFSCNGVSKCDCYENYFDMEKR